MTPIEKIKLIMTEKGFTKTKIAKELGTSPTTIENWLSSKYSPTRKKLLNVIDSIYNSLITPDPQTAPTKISSEDRVKFYSNTDLSSRVNIHLALLKLDKIKNQEISKFDINDILEFSNIIKYNEEKKFSNFFKPYIKEIKLLKKYINQYLSKLNSKNIDRKISNLYYEYDTDLLELLSIKKTHNFTDNSTHDSLISSLSSANISVETMLSVSNFVTTYDQAIKKYFLNSPKNAICIIKKYFYSESFGKNITLPKSLTYQESETLLLSYIHSEHREYDPFVKVLASAHPLPKGSLRNEPGKQSGVSLEVIMAAKKSLAKTAKMKIPQQVPPHSIPMFQIIFSKDQEEPFSYSVAEDRSIIYSYSYNWLKSHCTPPETIIHFIKLFPIVNEQMLLTLPSFSSDIKSSLTNILFRYQATNLDKYETSIQYSSKNGLADIQIRLYNKLAIHERGSDYSIESALRFFYTDFLSKSYNINNFVFDAIKEEPASLNHLIILASRPESILRQYWSFCRSDNADRNLVETIDFEFLYKDIPSLVKNKYLVLPKNDDTLENICYLLFNNQSGLAYIDQNKNANNFTELISKKVKYQDFHSYQKNNINFLLQQGIIKKQPSGTLQFADQDQIFILDQFYQYEALSYHRLCPRLQKTCNSMAEKGWLIFQDTLLTPAESEYLTYLLRNNLGQNSPAIRNRYLHGLCDHLKPNQHQKNYIILLKALLSITLKIYDDISLSVLASKQKPLSSN